MKKTILILCFLVTSGYAADGIDMAKKECSDIGFKIGSDKHRECVLELYKRTKDKKINKLNKIYSKTKWSPSKTKCLSFGFKEQTHGYSECLLRLHNLETRQAQVKSQLAKQEAELKAEKKRQDDMGWLRVGLWLMSGGADQTYRDAISQNSRIKRNSHSIHHENLRTHIKMPDGSMVTCMKHINIFDCK